MAEAIYVNSDEVRGVLLSGRRATANNDNTVYANVEDTNTETKDKAGYQHAGRPQTSPPSSLPVIPVLHTFIWTRKSRTLAVSLVVLCFLLLAGIIGLLVYYSRLTGLHDSEMQSLRNRNLTEDYIQLETNKDMLQKDVDRLLIEATGLQENYRRLAEDLNQLKTSYANVTKQLNILCKDEYLLNKVRKNCPAGWQVSGCKYYFFSTETANWIESRKHCQKNGADLVIINSREEHDFLMTNSISRAWIGLTDRASKGTWRWVDGTFLQGEGFWKTGEPSKGNNEDCVHLIIEGGWWNDALCTNRINWICEKWGLKA